MYHSESKTDVSSGDKPYTDLEIVNEVKKLFRIASKRSKTSTNQNSSLFEEK